MAEIASAYISLLPSGRNFGAKLQSAIGGDVDRAGAASGKRFGAGMLGGVGGPLKLLGGAFAAVKVAGFLQGAISEAREAAKVTALTAQAIKTTGGAAGISATQVGTLATSLSNLTGIDDEAVQGAENLLLTFTNVRNGVGKGNDVFSQATGLALDMSTALGTDASGAALQLGKALNDPVKGIGALSRAGVSFTAAQKAQIKSLVASGRAMDAQKVILGELAKEFGGAAAVAASPADKARVAWGNFKETIGTAVLPIIDNILNGFTRVTGFLTSTAVPTLQKLGEGVSGVFAILARGDFAGAAKTFGWAEDSGQVAFLFRMRDALVSLGSFLSGTVLPALRAFGGFLAANIVPALQLVAAFVTANFLPALGAIGAFITTTLVPALQKIGAFVTTTVLPALQRVGAFVTANFLPALGAIGSFITGTVLPAVSSLASFLAANIIPVLQAVGAFVAGSVIPALAGLAARVRENLPAFISLGTFIGKVAAVIAGLAVIVISRVVPVLLRLAGPVFQAIFSAVGVAIGVIGGIIRTVGRFADTVSSAARGVSGFATSAGEAFGRLKDAVRTKIGEAVDFVKGLPGKIVEAVGDLGGLLFDAGAKVISGLIDGIKSKVGAVGDAVKGIADKIGRFLPGSPVREGALRVLNHGYAGQQIVRMLADGMTGDLGRVHLASGALGAAATPAVGRFAAYSAPVPAFPDHLAGGASTSATVNMYGSNPDQVLTQVQRAQRLAALQHA